MAQIGAIFWQPFYDMVDQDMDSPGLGRAEAAMLAPNKYHDRVPLHGVLGDNTVVWAPTQQTFDAEITATHGKLDYWVYLMGAPLARAHNNAWRLHQSSSIRDQMPWCWMWDLGCLGSNIDGNTPDFTDEVTMLVTHMGQTSYRKTLTTRPIFYLYWSDSQLSSLWNNDPFKVKAALQAIKAAAATAGLGEPYIVLMMANPQDAQDMRILLGGAAGGIDAISAYNHSVPSLPYQPFSALCAFGTSYWDFQKGVGSKIIPPVMIGWNKSPRVERTMPYASKQIPYFGLAIPTALPTLEEITTQVAACKAFVLANSNVCESGDILLYAYSEYDEGGWCGPTHGDPTGQRLAAVAAGMV